MRMKQKKEDTMMIGWIMGNIGTIVVILILTAVVTGIVFIMIRDKKQGKSSCGGNCANCKLCSGCQSSGECNANAGCKGTAKAKK